MTDTTNHATPLEVVTRWFEKARDTCAKQGRHESALLWSDGLAHLIRMNAALDALTRELDDQERSHLKTIDQRDAAEDALGDAYALVTGNQPEWSSAFGYADAMEDITNAIASQSARIATLEAFIADLDCECTPPERLVDGEMTEKWICLRCAALAPSKGEL